MTITRQGRASARNRDRATRDLLLLHGAHPQRAHVHEDRALALTDAISRRTAQLQKFARRLPRRRGKTGAPSALRRGRATENFFGTLQIPHTI
jgi:C4-dicarboxylate-specific signal transduction histidine kinase